MIKGEELKRSWHVYLLLTTTVQVQFWNVVGLNISSRPILVTYVYVTNTWKYIVFWTNNKVK